MTLAVSAPDFVGELDDTTCSVCGYPSVGVVTHDRVDPFCSAHAVDAIAAALLSNPSKQPVVSLNDLDIFRPWSAA